MYAEFLRPYLLIDSMDIVLEILRVFGNFSRHGDIRGMLLEKRGVLCGIVDDSSLS